MGGQAGGRGHRTCSDLERRRSQAHGARMRERGSQVPSWVELGVSARKTLSLTPSLTSGLGCSRPGKGKVSYMTTLGLCRWGQNRSENVRISFPNRPRLGVSMCNSLSRNKGGKEPLRPAQAQGGVLPAQSPEQMGGGGTPNAGCSALGLGKDPWSCHSVLAHNPSEGSTTGPAGTEAPQPEE